MDAKTVDEIELWGQKVDKIAKNDPEYMSMDPLALITTAIATECLLKSLASDSLTLASYRKQQQQGYLQRGSGANNSSSTNSDDNEIYLAYNDIADCISIKEEYGFLSDMIPRTKNLRELVKENKVRYTTVTTDSINNSVSTGASDSGINYNSSNTPISIASATPTRTVPSDGVNNINSTNIVTIDVQNETESEHESI